MITKEFYLLVAGSRGYQNYKEFTAVLDYILSEQVNQGKNIIFVSGRAKGTDTMAEWYAHEKGYGIYTFPAQWDEYGYSAGYKRNIQMHQFIANLGKRNRGCICFWDMHSKGTRHNFQLAKTYGTALKVFNTRQHCFLDEKLIDKLS